MNNQHYSEADLLETYYTQPGASLPAMMHLADCPPCAARYERLDAKLRSLGSCESERPETFWARQRHGVMRNIATAKQQRTGASPFRVAAAAALAFILGGLAFYPRQTATQTATPVTITAAATAPPATDTTIAEDPWQSDELNEYEPMVAWESWVEPSDLAKAEGRS